MISICRDHFFKKMANSLRMRLEGLWYMYIEVIYSVDDNMVVFT